MMFFFVFILVVITTISFTNAQGGKPAIALLLTLSAFILILYLIGHYNTVDITTPNTYKY